MPKKTTTGDPGDKSAAAAAAAASDYDESETKKADEPISKKEMRKSKHGIEYATVIERPSITEGYVRKANAQVTIYKWRYAKDMLMKWEGNATE